MIGFEKLMAATIEHGLPTRFYEAGPSRSQRCLTKLIEQGVFEGVLEPLEPIICYAAAEDLMALWQGMMRVEMALEGSLLPDDIKLNERVQRGISLFVPLYGKRP